MDGRQPPNRKQLIDFQIREMRVHPELYKIDRRVALASCWFEFFDLFWQIFCQDARTLSYYLNHDLAWSRVVEETQFVRGFKVEDSEIQIVAF